MCVRVWEILRSHTPLAMSKGVAEMIELQLTRQRNMHCMKTLKRPFAKRFSFLIVFLFLYLAIIDMLTSTQLQGVAPNGIANMNTSFRLNINQSLDNPPAKKAQDEASKRKTHEFYNDNDPKNRSFLNHTSTFVLIPARMLEPR